MRVRSFPKHVCTNIGRAARGSASIHLLFFFYFLFFFGWPNPTLEMCYGQPKSLTFSIRSNRLTRDCAVGSYLHLAARGKQVCILPVYIWLSSRLSILLNLPSCVLSFNQYFEHFVFLLDLWESTWFNLHNLEDMLTGWIVVVVSLGMIVGVSHMKGQSYF